MQIAYQSSRGMVRAKNEDAVGSFLNSDQLLLALIADGIGGNNAGEVASKMAVSQLGNHFRKTDFSDLDEAKKWFAQELIEINELIIKKANEDIKYAEMGTTIVAALIAGQQLLLANLGDSRGYVLHENKLIQLTEDHSYVNELVKSGNMTPDEAETNPYKNIITKSLGINNDANADYYYYNSTVGDLILLCTDGLTNMVSSEQIQKILAMDVPLSVKCQNLITLSNQNGGADNITVLLVQNDGEVNSDA